MNMLNYFAILDCFGVNMNFYLNGYKDYRSHLGSFVTILIYIIIIIFAFIFANEIFGRENPKVSTSTAIYNNPTKIHYPDNIFFMFGLSSESHLPPFINEKIYRPIGYIRTKINGTQILSERNLTLDKCSNIFNEKYKFYDSIKHINLSNYYCISIDKNKNNGIEKDELFINEFWGNDGFQMLQIKVYPCSNKENKDECESNEIIKEKLQLAIITYYTLNNYIDTNNYKNPFVHGLEETFYYISLNKKISATEYLKHVQIHSDTGLLFNNVEINADNTLHSMIEYSNDSQEKDSINAIFTISLQLTNKLDIYYRSYYKIQDLGAKLGAIYGALNIVFSILFRYYNTSKLFINIINHFFIIKEDFKPSIRDKKNIKIKNKFYNDLKLNISLVQNNSFYLKNSRSLSNDNKIRTIDSFNNKSLDILQKANAFNETNENKNKIGKNKKELYKNNLKNKKEERGKKIKLNLSFIDKFLCLYIINICRNRINRYSYYNLFYKGKDYIIKVMDIKNYLKYFHLFKTFFFINDKIKKELLDSISTPILSSNYVGSRFESE